MLFRAASRTFAAILARARWNCSRVMMAGMVAIGIQSSGGSGTWESRGRPIGWVDDRRMRAGRRRVRLA